MNFRFSYCTFCASLFAGVTVASELLELECISGGLAARSRLDEHRPKGRIGPVGEGKYLLLNPLACKTS